MTSLGLVIIARNQASQLAALSQILERHPFDDIVYVDSNSSDGSVEVAVTAGWRVVSLLPDGVLSAAAGRHVGTLVCHAEHILYLDGDMQPCLGTVRSFVEYLLNCRDSSVVGATGDIVDIYPDGGRRVRPQRSRHGGEARWFGGAVLLRRQAVIDAGNWNPNVHAEEEFDLHARLHSIGSKVVYLRGVLASHHTSQVPRWHTAARLAGLYDRSNPRNGGLGQAIRSAVAAHALKDMVMVRPEPLLVPLATLLLCFVALIEQPLVATLGFVALLAWVHVRRGPQFIPVCYLSVPQIVIGLLRYRQRPVRYRLHEQEAG